MPRPIRAVISQQAMSHNLSVIRQYLDNARQAPAAAAGGTQPAPIGATHIWAVIKANGYGHGLETAIGGFAQADGLAMLVGERRKLMISAENIAAAIDQIEMILRLICGLILGHGGRG